jgi:hypothetical protein
MVVLSPDGVAHPGLARFTPDGRFLAWGSRDGTVRVADMDRVRDKLKSVGFPGW